MTFTVSKTVSDETLDCIIQIESGGRPHIKAQTSTALGLGQFLNKTWEGVVKRHRPDVYEANDEDDLLALRENPEFSIEMLARFTEDNQKIVGMKCSGGDLYLAHFLGAGSAQRVYAALPSTPVSGLVSVDAVKANRSILDGKSAGQVRAWAAKRMHESAGRGWVAHYYTPPDDPVQDPHPEEPEAPQYDPQDQPEIAHHTDPVPQTVPEAHPTPAAPPDVGFIPTAIKLFKSKMAWATTGLGALNVAALGDFLKDWKTVAIIGAIVLVVYVIYERSKKA